MIEKGINNKKQAWDEVYNAQKEINTPPPQEHGLGYKCPDCKKKITGEIVEEQKKEKHFIEHILWLCSCGYKFAEIEEGDEIFRVNL